jgi:CDP-diacylglycerol--glycerol-3-phosphate 3-phosphatidyltransferase
VIKQKLGERLDGWIHIAFPFLFKRQLNPNLLTVVGVVVSCGAAVALALGHFVVGGVLILAGGFFDLVDGVVARHFNIQTLFGAFLDSTMDRLVDMVILFGIVVYYGTTGQTGIVLLVGVCLVGSVMTSYTKARAELLGPELRNGFLERGERIGLLAAGAILGVMIPVLWLLAIGTTVTAVQRFANAARELGSLEHASTGSTGDSLQS